LLTPFNFYHPKESFLSYFTEQSRIALWSDYEGSKGWSFRLRDKAISESTGSADAVFKIPNRQNKAVPKKGTLML
jgi:hypothetical protein